LGGVEQDVLENSELVRAKPWDLIPVDSTFASKTSTPYWEMGHAPPLPIHARQQDVVEGLLSSIGHALAATDRNELKHHLNRLNWDFADIEAFLATTANVKAATDEFIVNTRARRTWKQGRQVVISGKRPEKPNADELFLLGKKAHLGYVVEDADDNRLKIVLELVASARIFNVSSSLIKDVRYVITIMLFRCSHNHRLQKRFPEIEADWVKHRKTHHGAKFATWLAEQDACAERAALPPRPSTPPYNTIPDDDGVWSINHDQLPQPPNSITPSSPTFKIAYSKRDIRNFPNIDWSFLRDSREIFTDSLIAALGIRVAVKLDVEKPTLSVRPGRIGRLEGCSGDRSTGYVRF
jgi:hypothetical protein